MRVSEQDLQLFYKLHPALLLYADQKLNMLDCSSTEEIIELPPGEKMAIREALYDRIDLIDSFVHENPFNFSSEELDIVLSWKHLVRGTFILFRYLKNYAVFLSNDSPPRAYGVLALTDEFSDMLGSPPIMVETVLLPFNGHIIYDGLMYTYPLYFGSGIRKSMNDDYQEAKARFGIITSLPFSPQEVEWSDAERLKFYLKSERNREMYWEEIDKLTEDPELLKLYHQEMGKIHARTYGKQLREIGLVDAWFAILEGTIVSSGKTRRDVEETLNKILPAEKKDFIYLFHLKKKKK